MAEYSFKFHAATDVDEAEAKALLDAYADAAGGVKTKQEAFSITAYDEDKRIGGIIGKVFWNWLYADLVWVSEEYRGKGVGTEIMRLMENQAREMKLTGIYLWTESWQAPDFYPKFGFEQFVEFTDFPPGHKRMGFRKYL